MKASLTSKAAAHRPIALLEYDMFECSQSSTRTCTVCSSTAQSARALCVPATRFSLLTGYAGCILVGEKSSVAIPNGSTDTETPWQGWRVLMVGYSREDARWHLLSGSQPLVDVLKSRTLHPGFWRLSSCKLPMQGGATYVGDM
jgi:hypothetical protein